MKKLTKKVLITSGMGTVMVLAAGTGVAGAQSSVYSTPLPVVTTSSGGISTAPTPAPAATDPSSSSTTGTSTATTTSSLAFTGADITAMVAVGLALAGGGFVLLRVGRRRSTAD